MRVSRSHVVSAAGLALLLCAAGAVVATAPGEDAWQEPFSVAGEIGEPIGGRNITATVHSAALTRSISDEDWSGGDESLWVVADVSVEAVVDEVAATLASAQLVIGELTYSASTRPSVATLAGAGLSIAVPVRGPLVFELPADALDLPGADAAELRLALDVDTRLDSQLVTTIDLTAITPDDGILLEDRTWGAP